MPSRFAPVPETTTTQAERRRPRGWPARFPLAQPPNAPLLLAAGAWVLAALTEGSVHAYARATLYAALAAWAWLELTDGVNWFRRALGAAVLAYVVVRVGEVL